MPHICVSELGQHWFRWWLVAWSAPSHYLNQCWVTVDWVLRNKFQWNFILTTKNTKLFINEHASENIVCEMAAILSRGRWVEFCMAQWLTFCSARPTSLAINPLWPSEVMYRYRSGTASTKIIAFCLTAPSHYLNQCQLIIVGILCHSPKSNFIGITRDVVS